VGEEALAVTVRSDASGVEALAGVLLHSPAGFLHQLQDVPLAHSLLDPAGQDRGRAAGLAGLVGDVDGHSGEAELLLVGQG